MALFLTALFVLVADQLSKLWITPYAEGQVIFESGIFRILHVTNTGAAFGLFQDKSFFLTIVSFAGVALILTIAFLSHRLSFLNTLAEKLALGLVLGGTLGNLTDRLRLGHVTDFISVGIWPTFNVADSAVTCGVVLFAYLFLFSNRPAQRQSVS
jgi:signal peptidase II